MTCVVGVRGKRGVLLAGDSQGSTMWSKRERKDAKTFQLSDVVAIAYCGSFRLGQLLTYHMAELDDPPLGKDEHRWAVKEFVPHLRDVVDQHGALRIRHNEEALTAMSAFLLAVRGRLMYVESDFSVGEDAYPFAALGSGEDVAAGAIAAKVGLDARDPLDDRRLEGIARAGIAAATEMTPYVGGAVTTVRTTIYTEDEKKLARRMLAR